MKTYPRERSKRTRGTAGITLIEMLVVITIIALFSAVAYQRMVPALDDARRTAAKTQVEALDAILMRFNIEHARFPTEEEGLASLRPFMQQNLPTDPWKRPYIYRYPGEHGPEPDVMSYGADGEPGGEGVNSDIVSWK